MHLYCGKCGNNHRKNDRSCNPQQHQNQDNKVSTPSNMKIYTVVDTGTVHYQPCLIEIKGSINNHPIVFLVDSGSSHNFISPRVVTQLKIASKSIEPLYIEMTNGRIVKQIGAINENLKFELDNLVVYDHFHHIMINKHFAAAVALRPFASVAAAALRPSAAAKPSSLRSGGDAVQPPVPPGATGETALPGAVNGGSAGVSSKDGDTVHLAPSAVDRDACGYYCV